MRVEHTEIIERCAGCGHHFPVDEMYEVKQWKWNLNMHLFYHYCPGCYNPDIHKDE